VKEAKARALITDYDDLVPSAQGDDGLSGLITLGAIRTTLTGLMPRALASLKTAYPDMRFQIRPGLTGALLADIERGALDAALLIKPNLMPLGVTFREVAREPMQLIASVDEPQTDPRVLLTSRPFIRYDRTAVVGTLIDNWLVSQRIQVAEAMELDSPEAIASMVHANLGVSIVPDLAVRPFDAVPVKRIALGPNAPVRTLGLVHRDTQIKRKALDALAEALSDAIHTAHTRYPTPCESPCVSLCCPVNCPCARRCDSGSNSSCDTDTSHLS